MLRKRLKSVRFLLLLSFGVTSPGLIFLYTTFESAEAQRGPLSPSNRSCAGIGSAISKASVIARASAANLRTINFNKGSYEVASIQSVGVETNTRRFPSDARRNRNGIGNVEPDGVTFSLVIRNNGTFVPYVDSVFFDAKFVIGRLSLSRENYQAEGYIDHLVNRSRAGTEARRITNPLLRPTPALIYIGPSDFVVGTSIINRATAEGATVYVHYTCDRSRTGGTIGFDDLVTGKGILLNPVVLQNRAFAPIELSQGSAFTLSAQPNGPPPPSPPRPPACGNPPLPYCSSLDDLNSPANYLANSLQEDSQASHLLINSRSEGSSNSAAERFAVFSAPSSSLIVRNATSGNVEIHNRNLTTTQNFTIQEANNRPQ